MPRNVYKTIKTNTGIVIIEGSNKPIKLKWAVPKHVITDNSPSPRPDERDDHLEQFFVYKDKRYYLSQFGDLPAGSEWAEFNGWMTLADNNGVCFKLGRNADGNFDDKTVCAYTFRMETASSEQEPEETPKAKQVPVLEEEE